MTAGSGRAGGGAVSISRLFWEVMRVWNSCPPDTAMKKLSLQCTYTDANNKKYFTTYTSAKGHEFPRKPPAPGELNPYPKKQENVA